MTNFERITIDSERMGGVPCVRHLRMPVATVLRLSAGGLSDHEILAEYPDLELADVRECLRFAAETAMRSSSMDADGAGVMNLMMHGSMS